MTLKMKRKDLLEVNDDFSDFSLSSPARKIRRLDAELPPIMEEDEREVPLVFEQTHSANSLGKVGGPIIEELPDNEERAIVLFRPMNTSLLQSPSGYSISVDSDIISGFKNWYNGSNPLRASKDEEEQLDDNQGTCDRSLAVVPWVPSKFTQEPTAATQELLLPRTNASDLMDAEESEATTMDIEDESSSNGLNQMPPTSVMGGVWPQHCVFPEPPQNTFTPIVWYR